MKNSNYDAIIIGAGFAGAVWAQQLASRQQKVLVLEQRPHLGGNMYEETLKNGLRIHKYGPHIFHTNSKEVYDYLTAFGEWFFYEHAVVGQINKQLVPIPFNYTAIELLFPAKKSQQIIKALEKEFPNEVKVSVLDLMQHPNQTISELGRFVYDKVFANYTAKQWGIPVEKIDRSVINRVPVLLSHDHKYFQDSYQFMPKNGYNEIFENLLNHPNITVKLRTPAQQVLQIKNQEITFQGQPFKGKLIYTGQIDELFNHKFGQLPYRSLDFRFQTIKMNYYQPNAVVNYPNDYKFTRITEFKYLTKQSLKNTTVILKEFPKPYDGTNIPYYSINNEENDQLYQKYQAEAKKIKNLILCGRLAEYKYYNMDQVVLRALEQVKELYEESY